MLKSKVWIVLLSMATASCASGLEKTRWDLNGLWKFEGGVVRVVQKGSSVEGTMEKVSAAQKTAGWRKGDPSFQGNLKKKKLSGKQRVLYPRELKAKCGIWEKWFPARATVAQKTITGQWWSETVTAQGCRVKESGWEDFTMVRME